MTTQQLRAAGLADEAISRWVRTGRFHPVFRSVFAFGRRSLGPQARLRAAALTGGPGTVISHRSAAWLLGFGAKNPRTIDVISSTQAGRKIDGIKAHKVPRPAPHELVRVDGIPCTSASRTIVDLAGTYGENEMRDTIERAASAKVLDLPGIETILEAGPRRRGTPCLRRVIEDWRPVAESANFEDERILEVDLLWPDRRFVVEADSRRHHAIEVAFERDHRRDRELLEIGHGFLRVTWREAEHGPDAVLAAVRGELLRRGAQA